MKLDHIADPNHEKDHSENVLLGHDESIMHDGRRYRGSWVVPAIDCAPLRSTDPEPIPSLRDGLVEVSGASTAVAVESLRGSIWAVGGSLTVRPGLRAE